MNPDPTNEPVLEYTLTDAFAIGMNPPPPSDVLRLPEILPPTLRTRSIPDVVAPAVTVIGVPDVTGQLKQPIPFHNVLI